MRATPEKPKPKLMPDPNDPKKKINAQRNRARQSKSGRDGTILSGYMQGGTLG